MPNLNNTKDDGGNAAPKTRLSPKATELLTERTNDLPVWVRAPRNNSTEHYSGFARSKLYELAGKNAIRSVSIRDPGQIKGTRLFNLASILAFIEKCEQSAADEAAKATTGETVNA
jgi:hypothetical protein